MKASIKNTNLPYRGEPTKAVYKKPVVGDVSKYLRVQLPTVEPRQEPVRMRTVRPVKADHPKQRKPRPSIWNEENIQILIRERSAGTPYADISKIIGISKSAIYKKAMELLDDGQIEPIQNFWTEDEKKRLIEMYTAGATGIEMQEALNRSRGSVEHMVKKLRKEGRIWKRR